HRRQLPAHPRRTAATTRAGAAPRAILRALHRALPRAGRRHLGNRPVHPRLLTQRFGARAGCFICASRAAHWLSSLLLGAISASSPAAGPAATPRATMPAPRAISGPACTPAFGFLKVPCTYSGERSENSRTPLLWGM